MNGVKSPINEESHGLETVPACSVGHSGTAAASSVRRQKCGEQLFINYLVYCVLAEQSELRWALIYSHSPDTFSTPAV